MTKLVVRWIADGKAHKGDGKDVAHKDESSIWT